MAVRAHAGCQTDSARLAEASFLERQPHPLKGVMYGLQRALHTQGVPQFLKGHIRVLLNKTLEMLLMLWSDFWLRP